MPHTSRRNRKRYFDKPSRDSVAGRQTNSVNGSRQNKSKSLGVAPSTFDGRSDFQNRNTNYLGEDEEEGPRVKWTGTCWTEAPTSRWDQQEKKRPFKGSLWDSCPDLNGWKSSEKEVKEEEKDEKVLEERNPLIPQAVVLELNKLRKRVAHDDDGEQQLVERSVKKAKSRAAPPLGPKKWLLQNQTVTEPARGDTSTLNETPPPGPESPTASLIDSEHSSTLKSASTTPEKNFNNRNHLSQRAQTPLNGFGSSPPATPSSSSKSRSSMSPVKREGEDDWEYRNGGWSRPLKKTTPSPASPSPSEHGPAHSPPNVDFLAFEQKDHNEVALERGELLETFSLESGGRYFDKVSPSFFWQPSFVPFVFGFGWSGGFPEGEVDFQWLSNMGETVPNVWGSQYEFDWLKG